MHLPQSAFRFSLVASVASLLGLGFVLAGCSSAASSGPWHDEPALPVDAGGGDTSTPVDPTNEDAGSDSSPPSFDGCGVAPTLDQDGGVAVVGDSGVVTLPSVQVGQTADFVVSLEDSADVSETILGATLTGPGASAFTVTSTLPIAVPAGQPVQVGIRFVPSTVETFTAQLQLQTMKMGVSTVTLEAAGVE
jgi:hypothetical protein